MEPSDDRQAESTPQTEGFWVGVGRSLRNRNYRQYLLGHGFSNVGMWTQQTAELWLILALTGSGTAVGLHAVLRFGPILLFGALGGVLSDRVGRRKLLLATQSGHALGAAVMALAASRGSPSLTLIYAVVAGQGIINAIDNPLRRAFVRDLVDDTNIANAVSLQSSVATLSRAIGPALAGLLIARVDVVWCFVLNALSYGFVLGVLLLLDLNEMRPQVIAPKASGQVRTGLAYAWQHTAIRDTLILCAVVGVFAWNWTVVVPFYVTEEFAGGPSMYGGALSLLSLGALVGALFTAKLSDVRGHHLSTLGGMMAFSLALTAAAPGLFIAALALLFLGATATAVIVGAQARIQLLVDDHMSGRVLALFSVAFVGSRPIGGLVGGWLTDFAGSRAAFGVGALATMIAIGGLTLAGHRENS